LLLSQPHESTKLGDVLADVIGLSLQAGRPFPGLLGDWGSFKPKLTGSTEADDVYLWDSGTKPLRRFNPFVNRLTSDQTVALYAIASASSKQDCDRLMEHGLMLYKTSTSLSDLTQWDNAVSLKPTATIAPVGDSVRTIRHHQSR
jgi:hypothetical protein